MRLVWICNVMPGPVRQALRGSASAGGLWMDHMLQDLRRLGHTIRVLCPGDGREGQLDGLCGYATFREGPPHVYLPALEDFFRRELAAFQGDVVHIWGTEYGHTLAAVNAAEGLGLLDRTVVSIQGLCAVYAGHYDQGLPCRVRHGASFRDLVRRDNVARQKRKFALRGELERKALGKVRHVIGRTDWDRACAARLAPQARYHFCNETLRPAFYQDAWRYEACRKHRIFASSCAYPVKGFHYLLEAFGPVAARYPDARLAVPGKSFLTASPLRRTAYQAHLARRARSLGVADRLEFLGSLSAQGMKEQYLAANAFVLPSTIENSPNSLGEAMVLGVPCVAADVGGVTNLLNPGEGFTYPADEPYMLAYWVERVFALGPEAQALGRAARGHALATHDPAANLEKLLEIYRTLA